MTDLYEEIVSFATNAANEVNDLEWGFDLDHTGATTQNIAVYICPSSERRDPSQDIDDPSWDVEGPYIMSRGNYAGCWAREIYINKTNADGTPAPSPLDGLFGVRLHSRLEHDLQQPDYLVRGRSAIPAASGRNRSTTGFPIPWPSARFASSTARRKGGEPGPSTCPAPVRFMAKTRPNARGSNSSDDAFDVVPMCDLTIPTVIPCTARRIAPTATSGPPPAAGILLG